MLAQSSSWAINQLNVVPGDVAQLEIALDNSLTNHTAFQFDLTLPEGLSLKKDDEGQLMVKLNSDRMSDHQVQVSETLQNTYRIFAYSMNNAKIIGSSGTLIEITLNAEDDIGLGTIEGHIDTGILVTDNNEITKLENSEIVFQILKKEYTLTYKVDGENYKSYKIKYGSKITPVAAPTKEGYTFSGWSEIPSTMPAKDVTIKGSFTINKYKLKYMVDGVEYKTQEIEYGSKITPEAAPTKEGYSFSGWSDIPSTMPAKDVTVKGSFTINKYKLKYMVDGVEYETQEIEYGSKITPEAAPTKEGYTFSGWSDIPSTMPAKEVTVKGSFTQTTGIISVINDSPGTLIYDMQGRRIDHLQKGLNIIRMSDGKTRKVMGK